MDKKISELPLASSIDGADLSLLVHNNTDYRYSFATLLSFLTANLGGGAAISFGNALPQNTTGKNGDVFVNTATGAFTQKIAGVWTVVYTPPSGSSQADGTVLYGLGVPNSGTGTNNDTYINTATGIFYKKSGSAWSPVFTMLNGPAGAKGDKGDKGETGAAGRTVLQGTTNPSNTTDGANGDFYINTATYTLFGPKAAGVWGSGISIVGPQGEKGDTGDMGAAGAVGAVGAQGPAGTNGVGVPNGGIAGQVLAKVDGANWNTEWVDGALTIYNNDGQLNGNRNINLNSHQLMFSNSNKAFIKMATQVFGGNYGTYIGCNENAQGHLIFGNPSDNFIQAGSTSVGGTLDFYVNCTNGPENAPNGIFSLKLNAEGVAQFQQGIESLKLFEARQGIVISNNSGPKAIDMLGSSAALYKRIQTSGGVSYFGHQSTAGSGLLAGAAASALCLLTENERNISFGTSNQERMTIFSSGRIGVNHGNDDNINTLQIGGSIGINDINNVVIEGSVSGNASFSQPFRGTAYKKVIINCNALSGVASWSFTEPFLHTPVALSTNGLNINLITTLSTTDVSVSGSADTGLLIIEGY